MIQGHLYQLAKSMQLLFLDVFFDKSGSFFFISTFEFLLHKLRKDAPLYLSKKQVQKAPKTSIRQTDLKDFQKIFHSGPYPGLYL